MRHTDVQRALAWMRPIVALTVVVACGGSGADAHIELARHGKANATIILDESASERERAGAEDLRRCLGQVTGATYVVGGPAEAPPGMARVFVGDTPAIRMLAPDVGWDSLGTDEVVIRTVGQDLILSGGRPRGTVYAIYTFLQEIVGYRWWTRGAESAPSQPSLAVPAISLRYDPPFEMRVVRGEIGSWEEAKPWLRLTFDENFDPATHSVDRLLPKEHFTQHPDWFMYAEADGDAADEHSYLYALEQLRAGGQEAEYQVARRTRRLPLQPCLHSAGARQTITDGVLAGLANEHARWEYPPKIVWVTQCDGAGAICTCPECRAVQESEGSDAANWLLLVNDIAQKVEQEYPDVMVGMFAYLHTEFPPRTLRPRHNVLIYSALLRNNKLDSVARYGSHADSLRRWAERATRLYVWDYDANFTNFLIPHPNYFAMGESIGFFKEIGVDGVMVQSSWGEAADMQPMRTWVNAQMMWNPDQGPRRLMEEFLNGYYGDAGPFLMQYIEALDAAAHRSEGFHLGCFNTDTRAWLTPADMSAAIRLLDQAARAVRGDAALSQRVWMARRAIDFAWLDRYGELADAALAPGDPLLTLADPSVVVDELAPYRDVWGPYRLWTSFREYFDQLRQRFPAGKR